LPGDLNFTIWDENAGTVLSNVGIDFNSGTYTTDVNGFISIPLTGITASNVAYTIEVDVNSAYEKRNFIFDLNYLANYDYNLLMLESSKGTSIPFEIYQPNATTQITDSMVEWKRPTTPVDNGICQRTKTSSDARLSFYAQNDANYTMRITDEVAGVMRDYNGTLVTIHKPVLISNTTTEIIPYDVTIQGPSSYQFNDVSEDLTILVFNDTQNFYNLLNVQDSNGDYFAANKSIRERGGPATDDIYFYLVAAASGVSTTIITINNSEQRVTLPDIRIVSKTQIGGVDSETEFHITDGTGQAEFNFEIGREYTLEFYNIDEVLLLETTVIPIASTNVLYAFLQQEVVSGDPTTTGKVTIDWGIEDNVVPDEDNNITLSQMLYPYNTTIGDVNVIVNYGSDANVIYSELISVNSTEDYNLTYEINVAGLTDTNPINVTLDIIDGSGNSITTSSNSKAYIFTSRSIYDSAKLISEGVGSLGTTILTLALCFMALALLSVGLLGEDKNSTGFLAILLTIFFAAFGFLNWSHVALASVVTIGIIIWGFQK